MQKRLLWGFAILLVAFSLHIPQVFAGGGHFEMGPLTAYTYVNSAAEIRAVLHSPNDSTQFSVGEHVTFVISNARSGDSCNPTTAISDSNGNVSSLCTAQTPGQISVHIHSIDYGDDSPNVVMTFDPVPQQPTSTPVPTATPTPASIHSISKSIPTPTTYLRSNRQTITDINIVITPTPIPSQAVTPTLIPTHILFAKPVKKQLIQGLSVQNISVFFGGLIVIVGLYWGLLHKSLRSRSRNVQNAEKNQIELSPADGDKTMQEQDVHIDGDQLEGKTKDKTS